MTNGKTEVNLPKPDVAYRFELESEEDRDPDSNGRSKVGTWLRAEVQKARENQVPEMILKEESELEMALGAGKKDTAKRNEDFNHGACWPRESKVMRYD